MRGLGRWSISFNFTSKNCPRAVFLATSDEVQGLVAQGWTLQETIEIARDVGRKLIEAQSHHSK